MFGWFKSARQQEQEAHLERFIDSLAQACASVQSALTHLEADPDLRRRQFAGRVIWKSVMRTDRTDFAAQALQQRADELATEVQVLHRLGMSIAARLVGAGYVLGTLEGEAWLQGSLAFARLEGMITGYLERYRVPGWRVHYYLEGEFEAYRQDWLAAHPIRQAEDA